MKLRFERELRSCLPALPSTWRCRKAELSRRWRPVLGCFRDSSFQIVGVHWLYEVVDGIESECTYGILIVGGDENDVEMKRHQAFQEFKSVHDGHFDIRGIGYPVAKALSPLGLLKNL